MCSEDPKQSCGPEQGSANCPPFGCYPNGCALLLSKCSSGAGRACCIFLSDKGMSWGLPFYVAGSGVREGATVLTRSNTDIAPTFADVRGATLLGADGRAIATPGISGSNLARKPFVRSVALMCPTASVTGHLQRTAMTPV